MKAYLLRYRFSVCCIVLIFILCFCKPSALPVDLPTMVGFDKLCHLVMYLGTCGVIWTEYIRSHQSIAWMRCLLLATLAPALMSVGIEWAQAALTDYRGYDLYDIYANLTGVLLSLLIPYGWVLAQKNRCNTEL